MKLTIPNLKPAVTGFAASVVLLTSVVASGQHFEPDKKAHVKGTIQSRKGDLVAIRDKKNGDVAIIDLTDNTKFERTSDFRLRHKDMDITAMVPGLSIDVDGVGNGQGQLEAKKITFDPNVFNIEVAEEKQIEANQAAGAHAQSTANQGVAAAGQAQSAANQAQASADQAGQAATLVGVMAVTNAESVQLVNQRVSDLADYQTVGEAGVFFETGQTTLSDAGKAALNDLAKSAASIQNYMIEIAGYASSTGTKAENQKLSDERAAAVADYLRDSANIPMRRILVPAGYGACHPALSNQTAEGRDINQRVDVKVLVNKGIVEGAM
jgi:outer membrane protein OmpA-like peptidoglycan-associated protein